MFENIGNFFKKMMKTDQKELLVDTTSKDAAKERLHIVLMQDRANVSADFLELMKQEIIDVIKKYIVIDEEQIDVRLTNQENEDGTTGAPSLYANIPILNIRNDIKGEVLNQNADNIECKSENSIELKFADSKEIENSKFQISEDLSNSVAQAIREACTGEVFLSENKENTETKKEENIEISSEVENTNINEEESFDNSDLDEFDLDKLENLQPEIIDEDEEDDDDITFDDLLKAAEEDEKNQKNSIINEEEKSEETENIVTEENTEKVEDSAEELSEEVKKTEEKTSNSTTKKTNTTKKSTSKKKKTSKSKSKRK